MKTNDFKESIFLLIAVHYIFDLEYDSAVGDTLLFFQEFVCDLKGGKTKHSAVYSAISTRLYRTSKKLND